MNDTYLNCERIKYIVGGLVLYVGGGSGNC